MCKIYVYKVLTNVGTDRKNMAQPKWSYRAVKVCDFNGSFGKSSCLIEENLNPVMNNIL